MRLIFSLLILLSLGSAAIAHEYKTGDLEIIHPWARSTSGKAHNGAAYMTIVNHGTAGDRLLSARTDITDKVAMHQMTDTNGVMAMQELPGGIDLPAGQTIAIQPGKLHLMLVGLHRSLSDGDKVTMTLTFAHAGVVPVELAVQDKEEPQEAGGEMNGMKMDMPMGEGANAKSDVPVTANP